MKKWDVFLKPCPWCHKTPDISMPLEEESWVWLIYCSNWDCPFKPKGRHVTIRKSQKKSLEKIYGKLCMLAAYWNSIIVHSEPYEKLEIPLDPLMEKIDE